MVSLPKNKKAFLFDLDGVIIDSESEYTKIWNKIESCYPTGIKDYALIIKGQTLTRILNDNYPDSEIRQKVKELLHELEAEMVYAYCEGAEQLIETINSLRIPIAIVTSSDEVKMAHVYHDIPGFKDSVNLIIDATFVTKSKPDPEGYLLAASMLNVPINDCIVFEDSVQGVKAGRASGAYVVGITGTKTREELLPFSDQVIDSLKELELLTN